MIDALSLAFAQLPERNLRGPLVMTLLLTLAAFVLLWSGGIYELHRLEAGLGNYGMVVRWGGIALLAVGTWLGFAVVENAILLCYSDRIVDAVEARHYPALARAGAARWRDTTWAGLRLLLLTLFGNLLALPVYLLVPGMNLVLFLGLNGYVLGRGYFDAVALRRMDDRAARRFWRAHRGTFIINGAVAAALLTVPVVNLVVPIVGLSATVHLLQRNRGAI